MTRQEQIKEAARQRANQYDHPSKWSDTYYGFIDGAKWADQHPQWIPVKDELPAVGETVQIYVEDLDDVVYGALQLTGDWWCEEYGCNFSNITYWMRKPAAPRQEE